MGVVGSKRKYNSGDAKQGTGTDSRGQFDKNAPGGPEGDKKGEDAAKGEEAPPPPGELTAENIDEIKEKNFTKWSKIFSNISQLEQVKYKITALTKKQPSDNFVEKKIAFTEKDVLAYVSGKEQFALYLKEDIDKFWLMDESIKELMSDENKKGLIKASEVSDSDLKNYEKSGDKKLLNEVKDIITNVIKTIVPLFLEKTKIAVQHMALSEVIDYVLDTKEFKDKYKEANILVHRDAITKGTKTKEEVLMENREKKAEEKASAEEPKPKEGGDDYSISSSNMSGGDDYSMSNSSISNSSMSGGDDYSISNSSINSNVNSGGEEDGGEEGGGVFKTAEEKEYKKFKKEERGNFDEKKTDFLNDTFKRIKFIDTNQDLMLSIYSKSKVGVNVDKKSAGIKTLIPILLEAINTYEKEPDTTGAAGVKSAAPPSAEGAEKAEGADKNKAEGAEKDKAGAPPAAEGADTPPAKKDGGSLEQASEVEPAGGAVEQAPVEPAPAVEPAGGAVEPASVVEQASEVEQAPVVEPAGGAVETTAIVQEGGGTIKPKQKRHTRKKPQRINININVGDKNVIDESSSGSSDSSSSDSSSSDSEDEESEVKPKIHIKHKKHTRRSRRN